MFRSKWFHAAFGVATFVGCAHVLAQPSVDQQVCPAEKAKVDAVSDEYQKKFDEIDKKGQQLGNNGQPGEGSQRGVKATFDVTMKEQHWIFHTPDIKVEQSEWKFKLPQVAIKQQKITFNVPSTTTQRVKVGQTINTTCDQCGGFIKYPCNCRTSFTDNYVDVPKFTTIQNQVVIGVPDITYHETSVLVPHVTVNMVQQDWIVKIPEFKLKSLSGDDGNGDSGNGDQQAIQQESDKLKSDGQMLAQQQKNDTSAATIIMYDCMKSGLLQSRHDAEINSAIALGSAKGAIDALRAAGVDPSAVNLGGTITNFTAQYEELLKNRDTTLKSIDDAINDIAKKEQDTVSAVERG